MVHRSSPPTARVVAVLGVLAESGQPLGLTDVAREAGCSVSTCAQLLGELVSAGWVERDDNKRHRLGAGLVPLSEVVLASFPPIERLEALESLHAEFGCVVSMSRYDAAAMTRVAAVGSARPVAGLSLPLRPPFGVAGQALLDDAEIDAWLDTASPSISGAHRDRVLGIVESVRGRGWAAWRLSESAASMLTAFQSAMPSSMTASDREVAVAEMMQAGALAADGHITDAELGGADSLPVAYVIAPVASKPRHQIELHLLEDGIAPKQIVAIGERMATAAAALTEQLPATT